MATSLADLLRQGIAAARSGQKETARYLLTQVVERDENNVTAWLWLSGVVDSLDDKQVCLENVLALDPANPSARKGLDWIRERKVASVYTPPLISESRSSSPPLSPAAAMLRKPVEPELPPAVPAAPVPVQPVVTEEEISSKVQAALEAALTEFDNEYLCPYCAAPTEPKDKKCKVCKGLLWRSSRQQTEGSYWFWILMGGLIMSAVGRVYLFSFQMWMALGPTAAEIKTLEQFLGLYLGGSTLSPEIASAILVALPPLEFWSFVTSMMIQIGLIVLLYLRWRPLYWIGVGLAAINLVYALVLTLMDPEPLSFLSLGTAVILILVLLRIEEDFILKHERLLCTPDKGIRTHSAFYQRGREYARKKMWAVAVVHFRRAVGGAPGNVTYHLALAAAYLGLKRYERAESALHEAQRLEPDNPKVQELAALIARNKSAVGQVQISA